MSLWNSCVPNTVLQSQDTVVSKIDAVLSARCHGIHMLVEETEKTDRSQNENKTKNQTN